MGLSSWKRLEEEKPALAEFGAARLDGKVAYLATTRSDGRPRAHPVTPVIGGGHIFVFLNAESPRTTDLLVKPDFSLHCFMNDSSGSSGEFQVNGRARKVEDKDLRSVAESFSNFRPATSSNLFELLITDALSTIYRGGRPLRNRWAADTEKEIQKIKG